VLLVKYENPCRRDREADIIGQRFRATTPYSQGSPVCAHGRPKRGDIHILLLLFERRQH
jgi:hypothetical protein